MDDRSTDKQVLLVRIEHGGKVGWGECAPISYYQQSLDSNEKALTGMAGMLGDDPFALVPSWIPSGPSTPTRPRPSALSTAPARPDGQDAGRAGVEAARPGPPAGPAHFVSPSASTPRGGGPQVDEAAEFPHLKIKVGTDQDEALLNTSARSPRQEAVRVVSNCGWTPRNVVERLQVRSRDKLELFEQPMPPARTGGWRRCGPSSKSRTSPTKAAAGGRRAQSARPL